MEDDAFSKSNIIQFENLDKLEDLRKNHNLIIYFKFIKS